MSETEPVPSNPQSVEQKFESFTEPEARNLAIFCEKLITGKPIEPNTNPEEFREQMWADAQQVILKEVIPSLTYFKRNEAMEKAVTLAPAGSAERAQAEMALVRNYIAQLSKGPSGYSTTPLLTLKTGETNCVMRSAIGYTVFEELGIDVEVAKVAGHKALIIRNAIGELYFADPNNNVAKINPSIEKKDNLNLYIIAEKEMADEGIIFNHIIGSKPAVSFLYSMFNNLSEHTLTTHDVESRQLWKEYEEIIRLQGAQGEPTFGDKVSPEIVQIREITERDKEFISAEKELLQTITKGALGKEEVSESEIMAVGGQAIIEARNLHAGEQILVFIQGENDGFPPGFTSESQKLFKAARKAFEELKTTNRRLRNYALGRFIKAMHPRET